MSEWINPGPVDRWCPSCGLPIVSAHTEIVSDRTSDEDYLIAVCPICGRALEAITNENNGGMDK